MPFRTGLILMILAAIIAIACGIYAYFAPLTGVTGAPGPLAASFGALCIVIGGALLGRAGARPFRVILSLLLILGILLTAFAAALLHQWIMLAALAVCLLGWLATLSGPKGGYA